MAVRVQEAVRVGRARACSRTHRALERPPEAAGEEWRGRRKKRGLKIGPFQKGSQGRASICHPRQTSPLSSLRSSVKRSPR